MSNLTFWKFVDFIIDKIDAWELFFRYCFGVLKQKIYKKRPIDLFSSCSNLDQLSRNKRFRNF